MPAEEIKIGDKINYWLAIHVWGEDTTMRCSKVLQILSAKDMYEPHLFLDNGDTVHFGDIIQKVEESFIVDGNQKQITVERPWRSLSEYDCIPSDDKKAYRKSISRDSDRFMSLANTACKVAEETFFLGKKKRESGSESSDSDESSISLVQNRMEDSNGIILGPKCSQQCFISRKKCHHKKEQAMVNSPGQYLVLNATWWHHGYFIHVTELMYFTVQLCCVPSHQLQSTERIHRNSTRLQNYNMGHLDDAIVGELTRDLMTKWDDNNDNGFLAMKFPPTKKFLDKEINKTKNRYILYEDIAKLPRLQRLMAEIEHEIGKGK